ncbi:YdeI/OmpD-associated family protein [Allokutzneria oryzae]|uniref:YdeI family protein n=1 Tax=Allokutzneria oryzae TaxID=1378989 RepID=A0ABV5ZN69_9PSEU
MPREMDVIAFADAAEWESWLADNHGRTDEAWLKIAKKGSGRTSVTLTEALDVALCYGWIDSHRRGYDQDHYLQRYSPRRPGGSWSQVNVGKVEALIAAGRVRAPGLAVINAAKADGRWDAAYQAQRDATVPDDLANALAHNEKARARFELLGKTHQYGLFLPLIKAKTPAGRATQLRRIIASLTAPELTPAGHPARPS